MKNHFKSAIKVCFCAVTIVGLLFIVSEHDAYHTKVPPFVGALAEPFTDEGVHIRAKAYTAMESENYLNRDLIKKGYQPIQVTIQNNTQKTYFLSDQGIDLQTASSKAVASKVMRASIPRSIAYKVAGFFFWPFIIPGTIDTIKTFHSHAKMKKDYYAKSIKAEEETLAPYSLVNRVIFVKVGESTESFTLYLREAKQGVYQGFSVELNA